ncbi:MAG: zinc ribbon domain-containing protein [Lachnospiraceae bacterium]|nr:zinc ribbon domain-containing protein [Lachnospiraceae bacterium]
MYECPNCAANLRFDIERQQLFCDVCEASLDPYEIEKDRDAEESEYFDATVYLCPQCGGQLLSDDTTAATFCSYCGSSAILTGRISKCKRPKYIIPFQKTKEDCKAAYKEMVKGAFFAPRELKDEKAIQQFRAIYMPYWLCSVEGNDRITFEGNRTSQSGNYKFVEHTTLSTKVESKYEGFSFDASSAFPDQLSSLIEPFDLDAKLPFTSSFLSGFYADTNDVNADDYCEVAQNVAVEHGYEQFKKQYPYYNFDEPEENVSLKRALREQETKEELAMFPVWFLAYRKKDRVAYGVVNGQTGKVAVDLPIDIKKFVITALLLAIPLTLLFSFCLAVKPEVLLIILILLSSAACIVIHEHTSQYLTNEFYEDLQLVFESEQEKRNRKEKIKNWLLILAYAAVMIVTFCWQTKLIFKMYPSIILAVTEVTFLSILAVKICKSYRVNDIPYYNVDEYKKQWKKKLIYLIKPFLAILLSFIILVVHPGNYAFYYAIASVSVGMIIWSMIDVINIKNRMITRPLPQFNIRGGEEEVHT